MVEFVNIRKLKNGLSAILRRTKKTDVVVTSRGRPTAIRARRSASAISGCVRCREARTARGRELPESANSRTALTSEQR